MQKTQWSSQIAFLRLALGLAQGILLYVFLQSLRDLANAEDGFAQALGMGLPIIAFVPLVAILEAERLSSRHLLAWVGGLTVVIAGLAFHDLWRRIGAPLSEFGTLDHRNTPSTTLMLVLPVLLFIANALFSAASQDRRWIARYDRYFDVAWKQGVQLAFAAAFVVALWLVLWLGAALFEMLKLDFFRKIITKSWFIWPVSFMATGIAIHLTDVAPAIISGIRKLALVLLSWLLPLMVLIALGFLAALAATSLDLLWQTKRGALVLLIAAAVLVILANCAYQQGPPRDGTDGHLPPRPLAWAGIAIGPLLLVLVGLAAYAAFVRVAQYGWTADRVLLVACIIIAALYALGYSSAGWWNATPRRRWEATNIGTAFAILVILLALLSPVADPARIAVASQLARLMSGHVGVQAFDFASLRYDGQRYGAQALDQLKDSDDTAIAARSQEVLASKNRWQAQTPKVPDITAEQVAANLVMRHPAGTALPPGLAQPRLTASPCFTSPGTQCQVILLGKAPGGYGMALVIEPQFQALKTSNALMLAETTPGIWTRAGNIPGLCPEQVDSLGRGEFSMVPPVLPDLRIGQQRFLLRTQPQSLKQCS